KGRAEAVHMMVAPAVASANRTQIAELAVKSRLPVIYSDRAAVEAGAYVLRRERQRLGPPRCYLCGQDIERSQARRSGGGTADQVRIHHQSQSRRADRRHDSTQRADESGSGNPIGVSRERKA